VDDQIALAELNATRHLSFVKSVKSRLQNSGTVKELERMQWDGTEKRGAKFISGRFPLTEALPGVFTVFVDVPRRKFSPVA
jgi:hypothetical protein